MDNNFIVFCNADEEGVIYDGVVGNNIVPDKQYDYFFYLGEEGIDDLMKYKVIDGKLTSAE